MHSVWNYFLYFFEKVVPSAFTVLISVIFIIFAGEIVSQALCTGPKQLIIDEKLTPIVKVLMILFWRTSYPLAKIFQKNELKALFELHEKQKHATGGSHANEDQGFTQAKINMIIYTIDLRDKTIGLSFLLKMYFLLTQNKELNKETLVRIALSGYSYFTIYENYKENIIGTIRSKQLIDMKLTKRTIYEQDNLVKPVLFILSETSLFEMLMILKSKKTLQLRLIKLIKLILQEVLIFKQLKVNYQTKLLDQFLQKCYLKKVQRKNFIINIIIQISIHQNQPYGKLQNKIRIEPEEQH